MRAFISDGPFTGSRSLENRTTGRNFLLRSLTDVCVVEGAEDVGTGEDIGERDAERTLRGAADSTSGRGEAREGPSRREFFSEPSTAGRAYAAGEGDVRRSRV